MALQFNRKTKVGAGLLVLGLAAYVFATQGNANWRPTVGEVGDALDGVAVYYNGGINTSGGRRLGSDGYNLGLKFQCVEFVKRYYYERYQHRMPNAMGHAKDFFAPKV